MADSPCSQTETRTPVTLYLTKTRQGNRVVPVHVTYKKRVCDNVPGSKQTVFPCDEQITKINQKLATM